MAREARDYRHLKLLDNVARLRVESECGPVGQKIDNESAIMNQNKRWSRTEHGQTAVLFALMIVGLILFVGLAVDGGNALNERRITQNAADASALGGVHYMAVAGPPKEERLLEIINEIVESNGVPDTNGIGGDQFNDNVEAYYTTADGRRIGSPNCGTVGTCPGENVPEYAFGLEVIVSNPADTFLLGLIGRNSLNIGGSAVAVRQGGATGGLADNVLIALGECELEDWHLPARGYNNEFLGGLYSNSWFHSPGNNNHFHGQVIYVEGYPGDTGKDNVFSAGPPVAGPIAPNPFGTWSYLDFAPGTPIANTYYTTNWSLNQYWNASLFDTNSDGIVSMAEIEDQTEYPILLYNSDNKDAKGGLEPNQMRTGLYYAGDKEIRLGEEAAPGQTPMGTNGMVTIVSGNRIKTTEKAMNLSAFMDNDSRFPNLLFFSDFKPQEDPCKFRTDIDPVINMAGNDNGRPWDVHHYDWDLPNKAKPEDYIDCPYPRVDGCYVPSNAIFTGLIYAPNGRVDTADNDTTYIGAIVAFTIDFSGYNNLYVHHPAQFPSSDPMIFLDR